MMIDHARDYARAPGVADPMQLDSVTPLLFWMRWLAHFCAPVFTLMAGVSAGLQSRDDTHPAPWSWHLLSRGAVLVLMEFTIIHFAWTFSLVWPMRYAQVIWGIGVSMMVLGLLQRVRPTVRTALGVLIIAGHNMLDGWHPITPTWLHWSWAVLHDRQVMPLWGDLTVRTSYPVLPMIGLVLAGDGLGRWLRDTPTALRRVWLVRGGVLCLSLFFILRVSNGYGDPHPALYTGSFPHDVMSMLNVTKYPMSLSFVCMTIGPALLLLAWWNAHTPGWAAPLRTFGQVPMFMYIGHLYLLHALMLLLALLVGYPFSAFDFRARITGLPEGFGIALWQTIPVVLMMLVVLYPPAVWYARLRASKRTWVTRYL